jgi:phage tail sheath protein FI
MDGMGLSQYIQDVINNQSTLMRYMDNMSVPSVFMPTIPSSTANNVFLAGGDPGLFPPSLSAALRDSVILGLDPYLGNYPVTKNSGWQMFASTETQTIDLMIEAGYTDVSVQIALDQICAARQDCEVIHDVPYSSLGTRIDNTTATVEARQATGINSNRSSMFAPWGVIDDPYNGIANLEVPISGYISASMAACDLANGLGFAAAGLINGQLPLKAVTNNYLKADRDILSAAQINAIRTLNGQLSGIYTWDCLTMQQQQSALSFLPVRRLASALERQIVEYLMYAEFLPNNPRYRSKAANAVTQYLQPFMTSEALSDFSVVCNNTNNTSTSPQGQMTLQAFFTPTLPARQILFQAIICNASQQYATVFV